MFIFLCILISFCSKFIMFLPSGSNLHKINVPLWIFTRIDKSMTYQSPVKGLFPSELLGVFHHIPSGIYEIIRNISKVVKIKSKKFLLFVSNHSQFVLVCPCHMCDWYFM